MNQKFIFMNTIIFTGKLIADVRVVNSEKGNFISFTLFEIGKGDNQPKVECTQSFKGEESPKICEWLKKFTTVTVMGTLYPKMSKDKDGSEHPAIGMYVDKIEIVAFPIKAKTDEAEA